MWHFLSGTRAADPAALRSGSAFEARRGSRAHLHVSHTKSSVAEQHASHLDRPVLARGMRQHQRLAEQQGQRRRLGLRQEGRRLLLRLRRRSRPRRRLRRLRRRLPKRQKGWGGGQRREDKTCRMQVAGHAMGRRARGTGCGAAHGIVGADPGLRRSPAAAAAVAAAAPVATAAPAPPSPSPQLASAVVAATAAAAGAAPAAAPAAAPVAAAQDRTAAAAAPAHKGGAAEEVMAGHAGSMV